MLIVLAQTAFRRFAHSWRGKSSEVDPQEHTECSCAIVCLVYLKTIVEKVLEQEYHDSRNWFAYEEMVRVLLD